MTEALIASPDTQAPAPATPAATQGFARTHESGHFVSYGEHKFDQRVYRDIGYGANVGLSLAAVYGVERTSIGQRFMQKLVGLMEKIPKIDPKRAQYYASKSFFLVGGFAILIPMKWYEDHKAEKVKAANREYYGDAVDTDPTLIQSQKELEAAPKQSWSSIMGSRILALIPFYALMALVWDNKSVLSTVSNPQMRGMSKQARTALEESNLSEFSKIAGKGWYIDRPITAVSRWIGKGVAKITGNTQALQRIDDMGQQFPGMFKEGKVASLARDPDHVAWPYYIINEAITSALVARGVYLLTRMLAPIIGKKDGVAPAVAPADSAQTTQPSIPESQAAVQASAARAYTKHIAPLTQVECHGIAHEVAQKADEKQPVLV